MGYTINYSKGNWRLGNHDGEVVTDDPTGFPESSGHGGDDAMKYYGGNLIAESILKKPDAQLISAAPDMEHALRSLLEGLEPTEPDKFPGHSEAYLRTVAIPRAKEALKKAGVIS